MINNNSKKGISLIVLVLTIFVILILIGAAMVTITNNNPMVRAQESVYKQDLRAFIDELASNNISGILSGKLDDVTVTGYNSIKNYIPCFTEDYANELIIFEGELAMLESASAEHKKIAKELGIKIMGDVPNPDPDPNPPVIGSKPVVELSKLGVFNNGIFYTKSNFIRQEPLQFTVEFKNDANNVIVDKFTKNDIILNGFVADVRDPIPYSNNKNKFLVTMYTLDIPDGNVGRKTITISRGVARSPKGEVSEKATTIEFILSDPGYSRPPMPNGFSHISGEWWNAYTIQDKNGNQFVWVPSSSIVSEYGIQGNLSTTVKNKQFGLRAWERYYDGSELMQDGQTKFSTTEYRDWTMTFNNYKGQQRTYQDLVKSVEYYGGYYLARYEAGRGAGDVPTSKKGMDVWINISGIDEVKNVAESMGQKNGWPTTGDYVASPILPYGSHYDTYFAWLISYRGVNRAAIESNSGGWGNYKKYDPNGVAYPTVGTGELQKTGSNDAVFGKNGISDLAGNVYEYTTEKDKNNNRVLRGGSFKTVHTATPASGRYANYIAAGSYGFRVALYIEVPSI